MASTTTYYTLTPTIEKSKENKKQHQHSGESILTSNSSSSSSKEMITSTHLVEPVDSMWRTMRYLLNKFELNYMQLESIMDRIIRDYKFGLNKRTNKDATVKMIPSYVTETLITLEVPETYLALDLGGTNFRVLIVEIEPATETTKLQCKIDSKIYKVPTNMMQEDGKVLFNHLANCIADFIHIKKIKAKELPIGFTFSFPCSQSSLSSSVLLTWTKGFKAPGVIGNDIGALLNDAIARCKELKDFKVKVSAICNDTVGTLMSCVFEDPDCMIGLIVGTGSNACYMEKTRRIEMLSDEVRDANENMVINCEWGNFGANGVLSDIISVQDTEVDQKSPNPGKQIFEKMISGMYLGELVRLILVQLFEVGVCFFGENIDTLKNYGSFETSLVSLILSCEDDDIMEIQNLIASHLEIGAVAHDCQVVYHVCSVISKRAAMLCACGVAGIAYLIAAPDKKVQIDPTLTDYLNSGERSSLTSPAPSRQTSDAVLNEQDISSTSESSGEFKSIGNELVRKKRIVCGVDGTVYRKHPTFAKHLKEYTNNLVPNNVILEYALSHDGSGKGAALTALTNGKKK